MSFSWGRISAASIPLIFVVALVAGSALVAASAAGPGRAATLVYGDEFAGAAGSAPDPSRWLLETGGGGWGNKELECYTASTANAQLDGLGDLLIIARHAPGKRCADGHVNDYTSARLDSRWSFQYGTIEMRAEMPTGHGIWPAFWSLGTNFAQVGWPAAGEMDFSEVVGKQPMVDNVAVHGPRGGGSRDYSLGGSLDAGADLSQDFHIYSATWTPGSISFYFDGRLVRQVTPANVPGGGKWVFDHPFYALLNVAVGGSWPGSPDATTTFPQVMTIDYVRVYQ